MSLRALDMQVSALAEAARQNRLAALAWIAALYLALLLLGADWSRAATSEGLNVAPGTVLGRDFANIYAGGHLVTEGKLSLLYDLQAYQSYQKALFAGAVEGHNYSYGPVSFLYAWLFSLFPYLLSYLLWTALTGAAFAVASRPYLSEVGIPARVALILPASLINVWAGHYGFLIGALWLGAWHLLETRPRLAGLLVGLMLVKPHLALLMPLLLLRRRAWTTILCAGLTVAGACLLTLVLFGVQPWIDYLTKTLGLQAAMVDEVDQFFLLMMPTVAPSLFRAGLSDTLVWIVQIIVALAAVGALLWRMPACPRQAGLAAACATFLALPYAFNYDMTVVSIASLHLLQRSRPGAGWTLSPALALVTFLLPVLLLALNKVGLPLGPVLLALMLVALLSPAKGDAPMRRLS
jgi:hypothetical protein